MIPGQNYPIYVLRGYPGPKLQQVSLYGRSFSAILRQMHQAAPKLPWALKSHTYSVYLVLETPSLKRQSVSLYGQPFLALLDYVSRAHEIEISLSSVRCPSVASTIAKIIAWVSFKF